MQDKIEYNTMDATSRNLQVIQEEVFVPICVGANFRTKTGNNCTSPQRQIYTSYPRRNQSSLLLGLYLKNECTEKEMCVL